MVPGEGWRRVEGTFAPIAAVTPALDKQKRLIVWGADDQPQAIIDAYTRSSKEQLPSLRLNPRSASIGERTYAIGADRKSLVGLLGADKFLEVSLDLKEAGAIAISPDNGTLLVADAAGRHVWAYRVEKNGDLSAGEKYITLRVSPYFAKTLKEKAPPEPRSEASAIVWDQAGRIYVGTKLGVQVFDPTGRLCGVLEQPSKKAVAGLAFGGVADDALVVACGDEIYWRRLKTRSALNP
jgi:hypothetical protein